MLGTLFGTIGLGLGWIAFREFRNTRRKVRTWMSITGRVVGGSVKPENYTQTSGARVSKTGYVPVLDVRYDVKGRVHMTNIRGFRCRTEEDAQNYLKREPVGSTRTIYVNPLDPSDTAPRLAWDFPTFAASAVLGGMSAVFTLVGATMAIVRG